MERWTSKNQIGVSFVTPSNKFPNRCGEIQDIKPRDIQKVPTKIHQMPKKRPLSWTHPNDPIQHKKIGVKRITAMVGQRRGELEDKACNHCAEGNSVFKECVTVILDKVAVGGGRCMCCLWADKTDCEHAAGTTRKAAVSEVGRKRIESALEQLEDSGVETVVKRPAKKVKRVAAKAEPVEKKIKSESPGPDPKEPSPELNLCLTTFVGFQATFGNEDVETQEFGISLMEEMAKKDNRYTEWIKEIRDLWVKSSKNPKHMKHEHYTRIFSKGVPKEGKIALEKIKSANEPLDIYWSECRQKWLAVETFRHCPHCERCVARTMQHCKLCKTCTRGKKRCTECKSPREY